jgi:hypothetical protein
MEPENEDEMVLLEVSEIVEERVAEKEFVGDSEKENE